MFGFAGSTGRKIYPWWLAPIITGLISVLVIVFIFGIAYIYLKYWYKPLLYLLDRNFELFSDEQLDVYLSFSFNELINFWATQLFTVLYNGAAILSSIFIGIKRKQAYADHMIISLKDQLVERSGKVGQEYKELAEKKLKIQALRDLLTLDEDEACRLMELRATTYAAGLNRIYTLSNDSYAFDCCLEQIFESSVKNSSRYLKINGIAQYEFIGKYKRYFDVRNGTIDQFGLSHSPFLHLLEVKKHIDFQVLLLDPYGPKSNEIIKNRIAAIQDWRKPISISSYKKDIEETIDFIEYLKKNLKNFDRFKNKNIKIDYRLYHDEPIFRYYITGDKLFLSQYVEGDHGHKAMVFEIERSNKSLYYSFSRLFDFRWARFK